MLISWRRRWLSTKTRYPHPPEFLRELSRHTEDRRPFSLAKKCPTIDDLAGGAPIPIRFELKKAASAAPIFSQTASRFVRRLYGGAL
jgi:hypothetical protein